jgi:hypothetical protein
VEAERRALRALEKLDGGRRDGVEEVPSTLRREVHPL